MGPDGGTGSDGGATCTQSLPLQGRCLDLPTVCGADGGAGASDGGCVASCEYHPKAGQLTAVARWSWGPTAQKYPNDTDVWSTPVVGRVYDANCDGKVDELDAPDVIFVSGDSINPSTGLGTYCSNSAVAGACKKGVLRMLDGRTGQEIWSLAKASPTSEGFAGVSVAIGDIDGDGRMDIVAVTGEGYVVLIDANGKVLRTSDKPIPAASSGNFGWGGGLAVADMDGDGHPEIAYGATVFTTTGGKITLKFSGTAGQGGGNEGEDLSTFVDLDGAPDGHLELLAGNTAYRADGSILWNRTDLTDGFPGVGDFDQNGTPEAVLVTKGTLTLLDGKTGATVLGPVKLPGNGFGGPPTVADFDGDGKPEIGVAQQNYYSVLKPKFGSNTIDVLWKTQNHDLSSAVTGSSVFDFEGDGKAEVIYADECFLWVLDGQTGAVRFAASHTSFTATETSLLADIDGDGRAEMLMVSNSADPSSHGWHCLDSSGNPITMNGVTWKPGPAAGESYRGITVFGDRANSWVGTRTLWNEHTYHVSNICDDRDSACDAPNVYGSIPKVEKKNWLVPWLNDFRQNVQDKGLFDAPDATVSLSVSCGNPIGASVSVRNAGLASLPAGVQVQVLVQATGTVVGQGTTAHALSPGQTEKLFVSLDPSATLSDTFIAKIVVDPTNPTFHECRTDNDESAPTGAFCPH